ncbi:MAG: response regulator [Lysobacterales bacterium]|jgi:CheY-like chemotaxis protein
MSESAPAKPNRSVASRRVLLVEDVAAMRLYLRYALERHGVQVLEAEDLKSARQILRSGPRPTSVLLDLELPDGNGLELLGDVPRDAPVAALTGDNSGETARRCRKAGCTLVLSKSSRLGDISKVLEKIERDWNAQPQPQRHGAELADRYFNYLAETLAELQRAAETRDLGSVRRIGHRLRGTAVHFGYGRIGACAGELGKAIASGNTSVIDVALDTLLELLSAAVESPINREYRPGAALD